MANPINSLPLSGTNAPTPPQDGAKPRVAIQIPDHELLRRIGSGSYGEVWLARHAMGMHRAVKIVYRASFKDERPFERELTGIRKFEPISRSHEGFVDVLHVGIHPQQEYFYYVMELGDDEVSGQHIVPEKYAPKTLASEIARQGKFPLQECVRLGLALSQALSAMHRHELVHRDVKPSNIIFVQNVPKLADIGLVAEIDEARSYVGTEGFIPPEGPGAPTADVYGLGKVLYEACTGKDRKEFPALPEWWGDSPEHADLLEFNEILIQACQLEPAKRYKTALDLHADLLLLENGRSIKRLRLLERRMASVKKAGGILLALSLVFGLVGYEVYREWTFKTQARQRQVGADVAYANNAMESGDLLGALPYFADALRLEQGHKLLERDDRLRLGATLCQCPKVTQMWFLPKGLCRAQFSPDGAKVLIAEDYYGKAHIFEAESGKPFIESFGPDQGLCDASYSRDGLLVLTAVQNGGVCIWDATSGKQLHCLQSPSHISSARFSPNGLRLVTSGRDGVARVWDANRSGSEPLFELEPHAGIVAFACFSHGGRLIITCGVGGQTYLWNAENGRVLDGALEHDRCTYACFSPDDRRVVTTGEDHRARIWDVRSHHQVLLDLKHEDVVESADFSPDGRLLVTADLGGEARLWDANTSQPLGINPVLRTGERVLHACFAPDGHRVLVACADGSARIWDIAGITEPPLPVSGSYSQDGSRLLTTTNQAFQVWDATSKEPLCPAIEVGVLLGQPELSSNGRYVQTLRAEVARAGVTNLLLQVWEVGTARTVSTGILFTNPLTGTALSQDGARLVTFAETKAQVWDVRTGKPLGLTLLHEEAVSSAVFDRSGVHVATRSGYQVRVWDATSGQPVSPPLKHPVPVSSMEFSPDGSLLATGCTDEQLTKCFAQIWSVANGRPAGSQLPQGDGVLQATFSADGARVVTASEDFTAIVWDAATGHQLTPPLRHGNQVESVVFSPDGHWVATASWDQTARIWSADTGAPLTPPLHHPVPLYKIQFLQDGQHVVVSSQTGRKWLSPLPMDERHVQDIILHAELLSGGMADSGPRFRRSRPDSVRTNWEHLRTNYPDLFATSKGEIVAWHEAQAEENERTRQWAAAAFHVSELSALRPGDPSLTNRLAGLRDRVAQGG